MSVLLIVMYHLYLVISYLLNSVLFIVKNPNFQLESLNRNSKLPQTTTLEIFGILKLISTLTDVRMSNVRLSNIYCTYSSR